MRAGSDTGMAATFEEFLEQCGAAGPEACPFAADSVGATLDKWDELVVRTKAAPVVLDGEPTDDRALQITAQSSLYTVRPLPGFGRFPGWAAVARTLEQAWRATETAPPAGTGTSAAPTPSTATPSPATASAATLSPRQTRPPSPSQPPPPTARTPRASGGSGP